MWALFILLSSFALRGHCVQETEEARISRLIKLGKGVVAEEVDVSGIYGQQSWTALPGQEGRKGAEIPKIIHQQWKSYSLPLHFNYWAKTWTDHHPDWQYRFWTAKHNRRFVARFYPWFLPTYDAFPQEILRCDFVRPLYLHRFGGLYLDLDMESLKRVDPLLANKSVVLAQMGEDANSLSSINNAFMASVAGHPFWLFYATEIVSRASNMTLGVESVSGPNVLRVAMLNYLEYAKQINRTNDITIIESKYVFPAPWTGGHTQCFAQHDDFDMIKCKKLFPEAYTITYWTHNW